MGSQLVINRKITGSRIECGKVLCTVIHIISCFPIGALYEQMISLCRTVSTEESPKIITLLLYDIRIAVLCQSG